MSTLASINKMHYIVDGCGNYYRLSENDQLVVAASREDAEMFSFVEANKRIGGGKKAHFYSAIPVEGYEDEREVIVPLVDTKEDTDTVKKEDSEYYLDREQEQADVQAKENTMILPYDMKSINWSEYIEHFSYLMAEIPAYQQELNKALADIDMQICDIMHYVELYNMDYKDSIRMINLLKECREQRRDVKDEIFRVECFQKTIGTNINIKKVKECIAQIKKLNSRVYHPRKLQKLFHDCPEKTIRDNKLSKIYENKTCMDIDEKECCGKNGIKQNTPEEGVIMEYARQKTVFDGKENDWEQFAKQQAEFYSNVQQYIYNLQTDVKEIDDEIEQVLNRMENANYNITQGYKVFKRLKELRLNKKEKQKELTCLYILTEKFDCNTMAKSMEMCVTEMETVLDESKQEEKDNGSILAG